MKSIDKATKQSVILNIILFIILDLIIQPKSLNENLIIYLISSVLSVIWYSNKI